MSNSSKCARCDKTVYPVEGLRCLDKIWHKGCFKCHECNMTLNMKNYKGFEKRPYCNAHCPQAKATTVADTPEIRRLAENTRIQSQAKYHEDFEKSKGKNFTPVADDPETRRIKETSKIISNVAYHGEVERKKQMEERRGLSGSDELPLVRGNSGLQATNICNNNNNNSPKRNSQNLNSMSTEPTTQQQISIVHHHQHQQAQQQYQQQQLQRQQQLLLQQQQQQKQLLLKQQQQQYLAQQQQQQQIIVNRQSMNLNQQQPTLREQPSMNSQQQMMMQQRQQQLLLQQQKQQQINMPVMTRQSSKQAILTQTNQHHSNHPLSPQHNLVNSQNINNNNNTVKSNNNQPPPAPHIMTQQQLAQMGPILRGPPPQGAHIINVLPNGQRVSMIHPASVSMPQSQAYNNHQQMPNGIMPKQQIIQSLPNQHHILPQQHHHQMPPSAGQHMRPISGPPHPIQHMQQQVPRRVFRALYDYVANDVDEVSFYENDLLVDCVNVDRNWLVGKVARSGQTGMLPANYVTELPSQ